MGGRFLASLRMIYSLTLEKALLWVGAFLVLTHGLAVFAEGGVKRWLVAFPRSSQWGSFLFTVAAGWFVWLVAYSDLGEFTTMRQNFLMVSIAGYVLALMYMREFLAVRAVGMLALLVAEPLLESAWMRPEWGRLFLVSLVYVWVVSGLFCVGMPYVLRDAISWVQAEPWRWKAASYAGIGYGLVLLAVRFAL